VGIISVRSDSVNLDSQNSIVRLKTRLGKAEPKSKRRSLGAY
jgi:hypothetical protein